MLRRWLNARRLAAETRLLEGQLSNNDRKVRDDAISRLGVIGSGEAIAILLKLFERSDGDESLQVAVADSLATTHDPRVMAALRSRFLAHDGSRWLRERLSKCLASFRAESIEVFIKGLSHGNSAVRCESARHLGELRATEAITLLTKSIRDPSPYARIEIVRAIASIDSDGSKDVLIGCLRDEDSDVRRIAANALKELKWKPTTADDKTCFAIELQRWDVVRKCGGDAVRQLMFVLVNLYCENDVYSITEILCELLAGSNDATVIQALTRAIAHEQHYVRHGAGQILGHMGEAAFPALVGVLRDHPDEHVRASAADGLQHVGPIATLPLIASLSDPRNQFNCGPSASRSLRTVADHTAVPPLIEILQNEISSDRLTSTVYQCYTILESMIQNRPASLSDQELRQIAEMRVIDSYQYAASFRSFVALAAKELGHRESSHRPES